MFATCFSTTPGVMTRAAAIPVLDRPSAISEGGGQPDLRAVVQVPFRPTHHRGLR